VDIGFSAATLAGPVIDPIIDWSNASVVITTNSTTSVTVTGNTTGVVIPFIVTITTTGGTEVVTKTGPLGGYATPLNLDINTGRSAATLMTVTIKLLGYSMITPSFTLLDVDTSNAPPAPYTSWQDRVIIGGSGYTLTALDTTTVSITGQTALGLNGNITNGNTNGNVNVTQSGTVSTISMTFGPGPNDQFGNNQRFGLTNISIPNVLATPEPPALAMLGLGLLGCWLGSRFVMRSRPSCGKSDA
jgi:hypothetical protein